MKATLLIVTALLIPVLPLSAQNSLNTTLVSSWGAVLFGDGSCHAVELAGNLAIIGTDGNLIIADVTDPHEPAILGQISLDGKVRGIVTEGKYAYVAAERGGFQIVDVGDPSDPQLVGSLDSRGWATGLALSGTRAFVAYGGKFGPVNWGLQIIDISDPGHPYELGFVRTRDRALRVDVTGTFAYVANHRGGFHILDVLDPTRPVTVSRTPTGNLTGDVVVRDSLAYVVDDLTGLHVFNVTNPSQPELVGGLETDISPVGLALHDTTAFLAGTGGLILVNVTDPTKPNQLGFIDPEGVEEQVVVNAGYAYLASGGIQVVDVRDRANPVKTTAFLSGGDGVDAVAGRGNFVYFGDGPYRVLDISDPSNPTEVGNVGSVGPHYRINDRYYEIEYIDWEEGTLKVVEVQVPAGDEPFETGGGTFVISGNYLYDAILFYQWSGVRIFYLTDTENPRQVDFLEYGPAQIDVVDDLLYIAGWYEDVSGLHVVDVSDPANPAPLGSFETRGDAWSVTVKGAYAYLGTSKHSDADGLQVVDVSDPANPTGVGFIEIGQRGFWAQNIAVSGDYAYVVDDLVSVTDDFVGLKIINIQTPSQPFLAGFYETGGRALGLAVDGHLVYVAGGEYGLYVIRNDMVATAIDGDHPMDLPNQFALHANYPNPFNPTTTISYDLSEAADIRLSVINALGQTVRELGTGYQVPGTHSVTFDAAGLPSGVYFYRLDAGNYTETKSLILAE